MKKILVILALLPMILYGQDSTFTKVYFKPEKNILGFSLVKAWDTGFMMTGYADGTLVMKIADTGTIIWKKNIQDLQQGGYKIIRTHDSAYLIAGVRSISKFFILKISGDGDTIWCKQIGHNNFLSIVLRALAETVDHGFVLVSVSESSLNITKTDQTGEILWSKDLDIFEPEDVNSVDILNSGKILICGKSNERPYFSLLDPQGNVIWTKIGPASSQQVDIYDAVFLDNSIYMLISQQFDGLDVLKADTNGNILNTWFTGAFANNLPMYDYPAPELHVSSTGELFFVIQGQNGFLIKMNTTGEIIFSDSCEIEAIDVIENGAYLMIYGFGPLFGTDDIHYPQTGLITVDNTGYSRGCVFNANLTSTALANYYFTDVNCTSVPATLIGSSIYPVMTIPVFDNRPGCVDIEVGVAGRNKEDFNIKVFQGFSISSMIVAIKDYKGENTEFCLYDITGRILTKTTIRSAQTTINTGVISSGIYLWKAGEQTGKVFLY